MFKSALGKFAIEVRGHNFQQQLMEKSHESVEMFEMGALKTQTAEAVIVVCYEDKGEGWRIF